MPTTKAICRPIRTFRPVIQRRARRHIVVDRHDGTPRAQLVNNMYVGPGVIRVDGLLGANSRSGSDLLVPEAV